MFRKPSNTPNDLNSDVIEPPRVRESTERRESGVGASENPEFVGTPQGADLQNEALQQILASSNRRASTLKKTSIQGIRKSMFKNISHTKDQREIAEQLEAELFTLEAEAMKELDL